MASGTIELNSTRNVLEGRIEWESYSNGAERNSSRVMARLQVRRNDGQSTKGTWAGNLQIDNQNEEFSLSSTVGNEWVTMKEFTIEDKSHNSDGSGNCYISGKVNGPSGTTMAGHYVEGSENVTLDKIPRYANIGNFRIASYTIDTAKVAFDVDSQIDAWQYWIENVSDDWSDFQAENTVYDLNPNTNYNIKMRVKRADSQLWTETNYINFTTYNIGQITNADNFEHGNNVNVIIENPSRSRNNFRNENR